MRAAAPLALLLLAGLGGCGSSAPAASTRTEPGVTATADGTTPTPTPTPTPTGATATATAPATTPQTATATTSTTAAQSPSPSGGAAVNAGASALPRCTSDRLAAAFLGQQGATGHGELGVALHNTGTASCRLYGYPGVAFVDSAGAPLATATTRTTTDLAGSVPLAAVVLAPGEEASFRLFVGHIGAAGGCTTAAALQVIAPDDTGTLRVAIPQGAYQCGSTTVTPVQAGRAAFP